MDTLGVPPIARELEIIARPRTDTVRLVTNDFMFGGGDGYTILGSGTNVLQPGDGLLEIAIDYVAANSPVAPVVEGRIVGP